MTRKTTSSNFQNQQALAGACTLNDTLYRVGMRWKMQVLFFIHAGEGSFGALKKRLPSISDQVLGKRLRELTAEGLVLKLETMDAGPGARASAKGSPRTRYAVTRRGAALLRIMESLCVWEAEGSKRR
ncbi:winged helix-turn-helix transcriptional regulator [Sorangium sp. So ce131]|uniref:winged helix-turn-helix transcriptional regulator n=1 Tax=Sorangium sp. So ce131 TaxID=3133282 RepID=UPI003F63E817